jgi:hypothetical protein
MRGSLEQIGRSNRSILSQEDIMRELILACMISALIFPAGSIADEGASSGVLVILVDRRQPMAHCESRELIRPATEQCIILDDEHFDPLGHGRCEGAVQFGITACSHDPNLPAKCARRRLQVLRAVFPIRIARIDERTYDRGIGH